MKRGGSRKSRVVCFAGFFSGVISIFVRVFVLGSFVFFGNLVSRRGRRLGDKRS